MQSHTFFARVELKPRVAAQLTPPCLPAYVIFMCIRHTDHLNNDEKVRALLAESINAIKRIAKKNTEDFETLVMWLGNTCRLINLLKQYRSAVITLIY